MKQKRVVIIGAGPGGLTAGLLLQKQGFEVHIFEKEADPGGRNRAIEIDGFRFDVGPTFLMMKFILDEVFQAIGKNTDDLLRCTRLDPMYRLVFSHDHLDVSDDHKKMKQELARVFPGQEKGFDKFFESEEKRFEYLKPCLEKPYLSFIDYLKNPFVRAVPYFALPKSLYSVLSKYFTQPEAALSFTFQSKYLGMSPWECPGAFGIIPYVEHAFGIYHVEGGLARISEVMAEEFEKLGGKIHYQTPIKRIVFEGKKAVGVEWRGGEQMKADAVVVNADFAHAMTSLVGDGDVPAYPKKNINKKRYSCSTFMLYLGLNVEHPELEHHTIVFADDYRHNIEDIFGGRLSGKNTSVYVRNSSVNDKTVAPDGKSQLYALVPTPNTKVGSDIDWNKKTNQMRDQVIQILKEKLGLTNIEQEIEVEKIMTPSDWENDGVYFGATFNLAHNLGQMLYLRPRNKLESVDGLYLVGGGTHPGSGLPTIYESGRITAKLVKEDLA